MSQQFSTNREPSRLARAFDLPEAKRRHVRGLFTTIADRYDLITRLLSFGGDQRWKARVLDLAGVTPGRHVLDLACGTGDLAFGAAARGARVVGVDLTPRMIELARQRQAGSQSRIGWIVGDMTHLPVATASIDVVTTGYGLRNVPDLNGTLSEIHRVLRPGGTLCSLDFDRPESAVVRAIYLAYLNTVGGALGWVLHGDPETYQYIPASIRRYPGARAVCDLMRAAGFAEVRHVPVLGGLMAIHVARRPLEPA
jgi:demethylmenaquinone methyltransferase/2-methoxy-6-polyprenyl-1,4-benzoquinol methylase